MAVLGAIVGIVVLLALFFVEAERRHQNNPNRYHRADFEAKILGKTEAEVKALLGEPELADQEPANSPQAGKRCLGYILGRSNWSVRDEQGGVVIYFSRERGTADRIQFVPPPQKNEKGVFIFVRF